MGQGSKDVLDANDKIEANRNPATKAQIAKLPVTRVGKATDSP
jgi:hypothetical protein